MNPGLDKFLWLLLGWLLGMLSPGIAARISRKHRQAEVVAAAFGELQELQYMMGVVAYRIRGHLADVSDTFLDWLIPVVKEYDGPEADPKLPGILEESRRELTEEQRRQIHLQLRRPGAGLGLKEYSLPLVVAMTTELSICPLPFQRGALRTVNQLDRYNQHVTYVRSQFEKTFDPGITGENRQAVLSNLDRGYTELAEMAQRIADSIATIGPA
jgi:hypothetical protein